MSTKETWINGVRCHVVSKNTTQSHIYLSLGGVYVGDRAGDQKFNRVCYDSLEQAIADEKNFYQAEENSNV